MNLVIFTSDENREGRVVLTDRRADHIRGILKKKIGDRLRVGELDGGRGHGVVEEIADDRVVLRVRLEREQPPRPRTELILALPRPIMLARILKQATTMGIRRLHLIRSRRVEKSYFHTPLLRPEKIREHLLLGLEQAGDTRLPRVEIHSRFRPFVEDVVPTLEGRGLLAHPGAPAGLAALAHTLGAQERCLLAVGPEGGWSEHECDAFLRQGFSPFRLGERILHVDTAVVALLAQLELVRDLSRQLPSA